MTPSLHLPPVGIGILGLGVGALLWNPLGASIGRRPTYLLAWTLFVPICFWLAFSPSYNSFAAARFFAGFVGGVVQVLPVASIAELYKPEWRGTAISLWSLLLILGPPTAPLICSAVTLDNKWQFAYYICIIFVGACWFLVFFFCKETLYHPPSQEALRAAQGSNGNGAKTFNNLDGKEADVHSDIEQSSAASPLSGHIGAAYSPLRNPGRFLFAIVEPLRMAFFLVEIVPALYGAMIFGWSVGLTILIPQIMAQPPYAFTTMEVACCFLPALVGSVIGKVYGGVGSDWTVSYFARKNADGRQPEYRLWNMIPPTVLLLIGMLVFGFGAGGLMSWWVFIVFGVGIFYAGLVAILGVLQTYMTESYLEKGISSVQTFNLCKCVFSFGVPFFIAEWAELSVLEATGDGTAFKNSYIVQGVLSVGLGLLLCGALIAFGRKIRAAQGMPRVVAL